jgi:hypothetical protein
LLPPRPPSSPSTLARPCFSRIIDRADRVTEVCPELVHV